MGGSGDWQGYALDLTNRLFWEKDVTTGGNWNLTVGAAPGGSGGKSFSAAQPGFFITFAGFRSGGAADTMTLNTGASAFALSVPSGFSAWDSSGSTTFNPSDKNANITLSGGNLTASQNGASNTWCAVRSTSSKTSGKWYFELTINAYDGGNGILFGLANSTMSLANGNYPGVDVNGGGYQIGFNGVYQFGNAPVAQALGTTGTMGIAIDIDNGYVWVHSTAQANYNNEASANPPTLVRGYTMPTGLLGGWPLATPFRIVAFTPGTAGQAFVLNAGGSAFIGTIPTNFISWDAAVALASPAPISVNVMSGSTEQRGMKNVVFPRCRYCAGADPGTGSRSGGDQRRLPALADRPAAERARPGR
jgi:hypothetical protein